MWEVLSLGDKPYRGMSKQRVKEKLRSADHMMDMPNNYLKFSKNSWDSACRLLVNCWAKNPKYRPGFKDIQREVERLCEGLVKKKEEGRREAWSGKARFQGGLTVQALHKGEESDYDVSINTSCYDYDIHKYENNVINKD